MFIRFLPVGSSPKRKHSQRTRSGLPNATAGNSAWALAVLTPSESVCATATFAKSSRETSSRCRHDFLRSRWWLKARLHHGNFHETKPIKLDSRCAYVNFGSYVLFFFQFVILNVQENLKAPMASVGSDEDIATAWAWEVAVVFISALGVVQRFGTQRMQMHCGLAWKWDAWPTRRSQHRSCLALKSTCIPGQWILHLCRFNIFNDRIETDLYQWQVNVEVFQQNLISEFWVLNGSNMRVSRTLSVSPNKDDGVPLKMERLLYGALHATCPSSATRSLVPSVFRNKGKMNKDLPKKPKQRKQH